MKNRVIRRINDMDEFMSLPSLTSPLISSGNCCEDDDLEGNHFPASIVIHSGLAHQVFDELSKPVFIHKTAIDLEKWTNQRTSGANTDDRSSLAIQRNTRSPSPLLRDAQRGKSDVRELQFEIGKWVCCQTEAKNQGKLYRPRDKCPPKRHVESFGDDF
ncbi:hypothetical protein U1Q18_011488 [Sarracenia purpurea var. burkii]